jgi:hypothetical protein
LAPSSAGKRQDTSALSVSSDQFLSSDVLNNP